MDRGWDQVLANEATGRLTALLPDPGAAAAAARGNVLRLLTMIATIGAAHDVTVEELRIETLLPADDATHQVLADLADPAS